MAGPPAPFTRAERLEARRKIVQAANRHAARKRGRAPYTMRHLQQCVAICRRWRLVSPVVLVTAGFRPAEPGWPKVPVSESAREKLRRLIFGRRPEGVPPRARKGRR